MPRRARMLAWAMGSAMSLAAAGCVSERDQLREHLQNQLASDILAMQQTPPSVSRMQAPSSADPVGFRPSTPRSEPNSPVAPGEKFRISVRARVNGKPIFDEEVRNAIRFEMYQLAKKLREPELSEKQNELFNEALNKFIDEEVVYQDAMHRLLKNNPRALDKLKDFFRTEFDKKIRGILEQRKWTEDELKDQLAREGLTLESWHRKEEKQFIAQEFLRSRINGGIQHLITLSAIHEYYEQHKNEFTQVDKVKWQNIFIAVGPKHPTIAQARQFAEQIIERWRAGEDFNRLLAFDDGDSSLRKGEGIGQRRGEIKPREVEDYLFALNSGEIGPPVEIATGVHIFRVTQRDFAGQLPFTDEVQKTIRRKLQNEFGRREERRLLQEMKARAVIEIIP